MKFVIKKYCDVYYAEITIGKFPLTFTNSGDLLFKAINTVLRPIYYKDTKSLISDIRDYYPNIPIEEDKLTFRDISPGNSFTY